MGDDWIERGLDEFADESRWRVIGAGQLAFRSFHTLPSSPRKGKCPRRRTHVDDRPKFQKALINGSQFLRVHVPVVNAGQHRTGTEERKGADRFQELFVSDGGRVEVGALVRSEQPAECGQTQADSAICESVEGDLEALPEILVTVVVAPPESPLAKA